MDAGQCAPADVDPVAPTGCTEPARCCGHDHLELDEVLFGIPAQHREDVRMAVAVRIDDRPELPRVPPKLHGVIDTGAVVQVDGRVLDREDVHVDGEVRKSVSVEVGDSDRVWPALS